MKIETARLIIRAFDVNDANDLHEILGDDETMENCEPAYSFEKTAEFLRMFCIAKRGAVAAVHKETDKVIGYILFHELEKDVYEIGWFFNKKYWRQGYAFEACKAVTDYAFDRLQARKLFAETTDGIRSVNLMKKLGMKSEGVQTDWGEPQNQADLYLYGILAEDRRG